MAVTAASDKVKQARTAYNKGLERRVKGDELNSLLRDLDAAESEQKEIMQSAKPAATPKKRIKVKTPDGRTGTIDEGDKLPEGWTTY